MLFYIVGLIHGQVWQSKKGGTWYMLQSFYPHAMDKNGVENFYASYNIAYAVVSETGFIASLTLTISNL